MNFYKFLTATTFALSSYSMAEALRYEAEDAIPADDHKIETVADSKASGGKYVEMADGDLLFTVDIPSDGYYTLYVNYLLPTERGNKTQNLTLNGSSAGQVTFGPSDEFAKIKAAGKLKLSKGKNTIGITHSWGWVAVDFIELTEYEATPWNISPKPVTPEPTESAQKLYNFLLANFGKRTISGVMTERPFENDGNYTPQDFDTQTELSYIKKASGKNVVLVGFDFLHAPYGRRAAFRNSTGTGKTRLIRSKRSTRNRAMTSLTPNSASVSLTTPPPASGKPIATNTRPLCATWK